jgi:archaemetzincin
MPSKLFLLFISLYALSACRQQKPATLKMQLPRTVNLQPFTGIAHTDVLYVANEIIKACPHIEIKKSIALPATAFYKPRNRYRADSLIRFLRDLTPAGQVSIGLTDKDISTSKADVADWGVMGLGFCPGQACVASSFRLAKNNKKEQLYKVAIHELGHTEGLPHCPVKTCLMRNAEGRNPTNEEIGFCSSCKNFLLKKGWKLD